MTQDASFDIVSRIDLQNLDNAVNNAMKEIKNRYDLKNTSSSIELDKGDNSLKLIADADFQLDQIIQVLYQKMVKLGIDIKAIKSKGREKAGGDKVREVFTPINGIEQEIAKKIVKDIKDLKIKVQATIQGEQIRVSGKSKDDLQAVISNIRQKDYGIALQFVNYR
ncbi:MAG: YajQ family cyclic di-GMP-binding protein [Candidatus Melainabacteria bacterium RIFCSPLOWO2_02_FULL_35_15]|nr:MAG: YajQ family cyclic di-GMP-binding protein [Candidatus Melainabacteria bacterium RIFCSPLOWO2_12_FULL_35_11]OGI14276.1 MAG: YajQ family cyclic di-GMP-binding protein [Candidatus Melainabacteria bacterium RIFCSPLOWO2_02_FULL_35_15]